MLAQHNTARDKGRPGDLAWLDLSATGYWLFACCSTVQPLIDQHVFSFIEPFPFRSKTHFSHLFSPNLTWKSTIFTKLLIWTSGFCLSRRAELKYPCKISSCIREISHAASNSSYFQTFHFKDTIKLQQRCVGRSLMTITFKTAQPSRRPSHPVSPPFHGRKII
jgi:hypothetical protein